MEKKRGGGGKPEAFDPNTGKYVADGQPNKYYDNPEEKGINNFTKAPNGKSLTELFGDIFGEENEEINSMFGYTGEEKAETFEDKYSKPILEMSQEELLKEIGEHKEWLLENNVDLQVKCFDQDLKLKCANLREMHRLFEKYPFFNNLNHKVLINERKMPRRYADCRMVECNLKTYEKYGRKLFASAVFSFRDGIRFNSNYFDNYDKIFRLESRDIKIKYHPEISESKIANCSFTHEFGHLLASHFIYNQLSDDAKNIEGEILIGTDGLKTFNKTALEWNELADKFHENTKNEIMQIYLQDNPSLGINDFYNEESTYAKESLAEWFAETFASMECGKPNKSALAMEKWLKQKIGN